MSDNRETQQDAMAAEGGSSPTLPATDETKTRTTAYENCCNAILAMLDYAPGNKEDETPEGMIQAWTKDEDVSEDARKLVLGALDFLAAKIVAFRDTPRSEGVGGKHYVGITADGGREHFKSATVPNEKSAAFANFKVVLGPFHVLAGAAYQVKKGRSASAPLVFHRAGTPDSLGRAAAKVQA